MALIKKIRLMLGYGVLVSFMLSLSCVIDLTDPSYYDNLLNRELEYCHLLLKTYSIYKKNVPFDPYQYPTPQEMTKKVGDTLGTYYRDSTQAQELLNSLQRKKGLSLGIEIDSIQKGAFVAHVYPESPAHVSSVEHGDTLISINDTLLNALTTQQVKALLSGSENDNKRVVLIKKDSTKLDTLDLACASFTIPSLFAHPLGDSVGYVYFTGFLEDTVGNNSSTYDEFIEAVDRLLKNSDTITTLIVDLRNTFTGYYNQAEKMAGVLLPKESPLIIRHERLSDSVVQVDTVKSDTLRPKYADKKIVVLMNDSTAGAAELFISALKENNRIFKMYSSAVQSFGLGTIQAHSITPGNNLLSLSCGLLYSISGQSINKNGISPGSILTLHGDELSLAFSEITGKNLNKTIESRINSLQKSHQILAQRPMFIKKSIQKPVL